MNILNQKIKRNVQVLILKIIKGDKQNNKKVYFYKIN